MDFVQINPPSPLNCLKYNLHPLRGYVNMMTANVDAKTIALMMQLDTRVKSTYKLDQIMNSMIELRARNCLWSGSGLNVVL